MLVILTNIPTPYRTAFFNQLSADLKRINSKFHVLYCAKTEPRRFWEFKEEEQDYEYSFLKGFHPTIKSTYPHINLEVLKVLRHLKPKNIIIAGAWNTPTMLLTLFLYDSKVNKMFWSEGHKDAQRSGNKVVSNLRKQVFQKFDAFLVPNENSKKYVNSIVKSLNVKFCLLPNTIDETFFNSDILSDKKSLRKKYGMEVHTRYILLISELSERKGVLQFVKAFYTFTKNTSKKYELLLLGTGILKNEIESFLVENNLEGVRLLGHVGGETVRDILKATDIFSLPTTLDPNPLTPIEASFMKTPLMLSTKAGNFSELLTEKTGIEISEINEVSILQSLKKLDTLSDQELKQKGINAYENVVANFSRKKVAENLVNFIENFEKR